MNNMAVGNTEIYESRVSAEALGGSLFKNLSIGDMISGKLTETDGKRSTITMQNGKSFQVDADSIIGEIGSKIDFAVADVRGNSVVMKQIIEEKEVSAKEREGKELTGDELLNWTKGVLPITGAAFASSKIMFEQMMEKDQKILDAINKIKRDVSHSVNNVNKGVLSMLSANGISASKLTMTMLSAAIKTAVKGMPQEPTAEDVAVALESYSKGNHTANYEEAIKSIKALLSEDLQITDSNIDNLNSVQAKVKEIGDMSRNDKINFLMKQQELTVGNLFTALHSSPVQKEPKGMPDREWEEMLPGVKKYLEASGIEGNRKNLDAARLLISNDIPVTKDNIKFLNGEMVPLDDEKLLQRAAENIQSGKSPFAVDLYGEGGLHARSPHHLFEDYKNIIKQLPSVSDETLEHALGSGETVTLEQLIKHHGNTRGNESNPNQEQESSRRAQSTQFVTEKRRLEEIRLRLTIQSASQMARAGVSINAMDLQSAINELKRFENENNAAALKIQGVEPTHENIAAMSERASKFRALSGTEDSVKRGILRREIEFTAEQITSANEAARGRAFEGYEAVETTVNAKFGDSFRKVAGQIEDLLNTLGIEVSPDNAKAARSLVKTGTDVTRENIEAVKAINNKIENVSQRLHPLIGAQMIKEGFNPLTSHIDEVIAYIEKYNELNGEPPVEAMEKAIFNMDQNKELSRNERDSLIGMYRMLSAINKNETVSSAVIAKSGKALSLENLMESGKYFDKTKARHSMLDRKVDDTAGRAEASEQPNSIREQLQRAYRESLEALEGSSVSEQTATDNNMGLTAQNMELLKAIEDSEAEINSVNINTAENIRMDVHRLLESVKKEAALDYFKTLSAEDLEKTDIRELVDNMKQFMEQSATNEAKRSSSENASFSAFKEDILSLKTVTPQQIAWMQSMNLPLTIGNLKTVGGMSSDMEYLSKKIDELVELAEGVSESDAFDIPDASLSGINSPDDVLELYDNIIDKAKDIINDALASDSPKKVDLREQASIVENAAKIAARAGESQNHYQIPIKLNDKTGSLNIYVLNEEATADNMNIFIRLNFTSLGSIEGSIKTENGMTDILITAKDDETSEFLAQNAEELHELMRDLGIDIDDYNVSFGTRNDYANAGDSGVAFVSAGVTEQMRQGSGMDVLL